MGQPVGPREGRVANLTRLYCLGLKATDAEVEALELLMAYVTETGNLIVPRQWWWLMDTWHMPRTIGGEG